MIISRPGRIFSSENLIWTDWQSRVVVIFYQPVRQDVSWKSCMLWHAGMSLQCTGSISSSMQTRRHTLTDNKFKPIRLIMKQTENPEPVVVTFPWLNWSNCYLWEGFTLKDVKGFCVWSHKPETLWNMSITCQTNSSDLQYLQSWLACHTTPKTASAD